MTDHTYRAWRARLDIPAMMDAQERNAARLLALARDADRKSSEYHADGQPIPAEIDRLIDAVLALDPDEAR